jgi:hypothetical protein
MSKAKWVMKRGASDRISAIFYCCKWMRRTASPKKPIHTNMVTRNKPWHHFSVLIDLSSRGLSKNFKPRPSLTVENIRQRPIPIAEIHLVTFLFFYKLSFKSGILSELLSFCTISKLCASIDINLYELGLRISSMAGISKATCQYLMEITQYIEALMQDFNQRKTWLAMSSFLNCRSHWKRCGNSWQEYQFVILNPLAVSLLIVSKIS